MLSLVLASAFSAAQEAAPVELGRVAWRRDHDAAFAAASAAKKPVLLFFQEVPG